MKVPSTMQDMFHLTREAWLDNARSAARMLLLRSKSVITIEDVLKVVPRPSYLHPNITGRVFQTDMFVSVGFTLAKKYSSHSRVIRKWSLSEEYLNPEEKDCE
jgi:hypothetical protein